MSQVFPGWAACVATISLAGIVPSIFMRIGDGKKVSCFSF